MPCFKSEIRNDQIIIDAFLEIPLEHKEAREITKENSFKALLDTGAQSSCISRDVVEALQLIQEGTKSIQGVSGGMEVPYYILNVAIPILQVKRISNQAELNLQTWPKLAVVEMNISDANFSMLLGMDVLSSLSIQIFNGEFIICY